MCCSDCFGKIKVFAEQKVGLSTVISLNCEQCGKVATTRNSKMIGVHQNVPEINRRIVYAMRCIGQGLEPLKTFCGIMDFYPPVTQNSYDRINKKINLASKAVALDSMKKATEEEIEACGSRDLTISGDGSWKTRGHTSQIGVCTIIGSDTGKVLDVEVLSTACKGCEKWKGPFSGVAFNTWKSKHASTCTKNHTGSSGKMEPDGMVKIFTRSESERGVRYLQYIGDGDAKTFLSVTQANIYKNEAIKKLECISHVQKRMGTRLRKLKKEKGAEKLSDGKTISGKGRLTDNVINQLSSYYGNAIRQNSNSTKDMRNAIWAIYFHTRSTDAEPLHSFCPVGPNSWCKYNNAVSNNTIKDFRHKTTLPAAVMDAIKPVFNALAHPDLLTRCLGAFTQNANESFNSMIWQFCPKTSGSGRQITEIAVNEAVILFNEGKQGRLKTMKELSLTIGGNAALAQNKSDWKRIVSAVKRKKRSLDSRRIQKIKKLNMHLKNVKKEGPMYEAGGF